MNAAVILADTGNIGLTACAALDTAGVIAYWARAHGGDGGKWWSTPFGVHLMVFMAAFAVVLDQSVIYLLTGPGLLVAAAPGGRPDWFAWERTASFAVLIPAVLGWRLYLILRPPRRLRAGCLLSGARRLPAGLQVLRDTAQPDEVPGELHRIAAAALGCRSHVRRPLGRYPVSDHQVVRLGDAGRYLQALSFAAPGNENTRKLSRLRGRLSQPPDSGPRTMVSHIANVRETLMPIETKVKASTAAASVAGLALWALGRYVFKGAVPDVVVSWVYVLVPAAITFGAGYLAKHTPRPTAAPVAPAPPPAGPLA